jgi:hypothetical protein
MSKTTIVVDYNKCIEAIDFIAQNQPGVTLFYICKVLFFADKQSLVDLRKSISGSKFVARDHGPIPLIVEELLKDIETQPDEIVDLVNEKIIITRSDNKLRVFSKGDVKFRSLSDLDRYYLITSLKRYGEMSFEQLYYISCQDQLYQSLINAE